MIDDPEYDADIIDEILYSPDRSERLCIPDSDMKTFLDQAAKQATTISPDAEEMLRQYFAATRVIRTSND
jgi:hypothetical protein